MARFIAAFDLKESTAYAAFLTQARELGWSDLIKTDNGRWYRLPNTTLAGTFDHRDAAGAALKATRAATERALGRPVMMPRWIVAEFGEAALDTDNIKDS